MARCVGASCKISRWTVDRIAPDGQVHKSLLRFDPDTEESARHYIAEVLEPLIGTHFPAGTRFVPRFKTLKRSNNHATKRT